MFVGPQYKRKDNYTGIIPAASEAHKYSTPSCFDSEYIKNVLHIAECFTAAYAIFLGHRPERFEVTLVLMGYLQVAIYLGDVIVFPKESNTRNTFVYHWRNVIRTVSAYLVC